MINVLLAITFKSSVLFVTYAIFKKLIGDKLSTEIVYRMWFILFIIVCLPVSFESDLSMGNVIEVPQVIEMNMALPNVDMNYNFISNDVPQEKKIALNPLVLIYAFGLIASLLMASTIHNKLRRSSNKIDCVMVDEIKSLLNYKKSIGVYETDQLSSPAVMGIFKKRILIPDHLVDQFSDEDYRYILLHEMMHLKQCDHMMNYLLLLYKSIFWFNPLTHIFFRMIKEDMEFACDQKLMIYLDHEEKKSYGHLLLDVASHSQNRKYYVVSPFIKNKKVLGVRIKKIMQNKRQSKLLLVALLLILSTISFVVIAKPISNRVDSSNEVVMINNEVLDITLANKLIDDYIDASNILRNYTPFLVTEYRDSNNNSELIEQKYVLVDDQSKILSVVFRGDVIESLDIIDSTAENTITLVDATYVIQTPLVNVDDELPNVNNDNIGQTVSKEVTDTNATKFVYNSLETVQMVYLIQNGQQALSILTEDNHILNYRYFSLEDYDINLETLFWVTFYSHSNFDYEQFKVEISPQLISFIIEDVDLTKNIFPVDMGDFYHVFLTQNYAVRIAKETGEIFYIKYPENIHYDAKVGLNESESKLVAEKYIQQTPLVGQALELVNIKYENLYGSQAIEYYVFEYASDTQGVYVKVNTLTETVSETTLYHIE